MRLRALFSAVRLFAAIAACLLYFGMYDASAQLLTAPAEEAPAEEAAKKEVAPDSLGRRTPRGTVSGFLDAMAEQNYVRASYYLHLKRAYRKERERERIVKLFQNLLNQGGNIMPTSWISNANDGRTDDELDKGVDLVGTVTANGEVIELLVANTEPGDADPLWQFSEETVEAIAGVTIEDTLLVDKILPDVLKDKMIAGVPVGHWLAVVVLVLIAYLASWAIIAAICFLIHRLWRRAREEEHISAIVTALNLPFRLYLAVWVFVALSQQVGISIIVRQRFSSLTVIVAVVAILILLYRLSDIISDYTQKRMTRRKRITAISIILFVRRAAKTAIVIFGIIAILGTLGFNVTAGLTALGIGGIALALGAQKTVENFVGSVTLIADQTVRVGDYCKIGDITGTVEAIGMRSTRLRTGERTVVIIPNGEFSSSKVENYAHRDRFLFAPTFKLRMDTTPEQVRYLLVELRKILYAHPNVNPDPAKLRFTGFGDSFLKFEFWAYIEAADFDAFQEVQEDILLRMMDVVEKSGTGFAFPSQTIFFGRDRGLSEEKTAETAGTVQQWRENNEIQLPKFSNSEIEKIRDTIPYPPEGSAVRPEEKK